MSLKLSRMSTHRLGSATINTPLIVLEEIASCHGITVNLEGEHLVRAINTTQVVGISNHHVRTEGSLPSVKRFVNSRTSWNDRAKLYEAFDFIQSLREPDHVKSLMKRVIPSGPVYPTESNPTAISPVILYSMCLLTGITTHYKTSAEEMGQYIYNYVNCTTLALIHQVDVSMGKFERVDLINLLNRVVPSGVYDQTFLPSHSTISTESAQMSGSISPPPLIQPTPPETSPTGQLALSTRPVHPPRSPQSNRRSEPGQVTQLTQTTRSNSVPSIMSPGFGLINVFNNILSRGIVRSNTLIYKKHDVSPIRLTNPVMPTYQQIQHDAIGILSCREDIYILDSPAKYVAYTALVYDYDMRSHLDDLYSAFNHLMSHGGQIEPKNDVYPFTSNYIDLVFSPTLPPECYIDDTLEVLLRREGFSIDTIPHNNRYDVLVVNSLSNTFHLGKAPQVINDKTVIDQEVVAEISANVCISYGVRGCAMMVITMEELTNNFTHHGSFNNPWENTLSLFSNYAMTKLLWLLEGRLSQLNSSTDQLSPQGNTGPNNQKEIMVNLINKIKEITRLDSQIAPVTRQLMDIFTNCSDKWKNLILEFFRKLVTVGFYMRGWPGGRSPFPITRVQCEVNEQQAGEIALRSGNAMYQFRQFTDQYATSEEVVHNDVKAGQLIELLYRQPLYRLFTEDDGTKLFHRVTYSEEGLTIKDRIAITAQGDVTDNINSCIRLSSNYFLATGYYYTVKLSDLRPQDRIYRVQMFDINSLQWIS